jgi:16S rRNA (guanine527-N7)-methyltransferase
VPLLPVNEIQRTLRDYRFDATPEYCERVLKYMDLLLLWNRRVSLTAVREPKEILKFHFGESLMGIGVGRIERGRLADVGSGAGFPGMPIAMAIPGLDATLIESNAKKGAFLAEVTRELGLKNVRVYKGRAEDLSMTEEFDFATARAVGRYDELLNWAAHRLADDGKAILWLGSEGLGEVRNQAAWRWGEFVRMPGARDRWVLAGTRPS